MKKKFLETLATRPDIELVEYLYDRMDTHAVRYSIAVSFVQDGKRIYDQWENSAIINDEWKHFLLRDFRKWLEDIITDDYSEPYSMAAPSSQSAVGKIKTDESDGLSTIVRKQCNIADVVGRSEQLKAFAEMVANDDLAYLKDAETLLQDFKSL